MGTRAPELTRKSVLGNDAAAPGEVASGFSWATRRHHLYASPVLDIPHTLPHMRFATHTPTAKDYARRAVTDVMLAVHLDICIATSEFSHSPNRKSGWPRRVDRREAADPWQV